MRLLLVEDNVDHAMLITRCLKEEFGLGLHIETAQSGEEALERLTLGNSLDEPELVIVDYKLPGLTGLELINRLRDGGDSRPVVLVTGHAEQRLAIKALRYGADDFVTKGTDFPENLIGSITRAKKHARLKTDLAAAKAHMAELTATALAEVVASPSEPAGPADPGDPAEELRLLGARLELLGQRLVAQLGGSADPSRA